VFGSATFSQSGERFILETRGRVASWRSYPVDEPDEVITLKWGSQVVPPDEAVALAAAVCDAEAVPNLMLALPGVRKTFVHRFAEPLVNVAAAAALCLGSAGVHFDREARVERTRLEVGRHAERDVWDKVFPGGPHRNGQLLASMRERLRLLCDPGSAAGPASALAFWGEIGRNMPDPDTLGLSLESLDLAPDGGRLTGRVKTDKEDAMRNAAQLEGKLGESKKLSAHGDYEVHGGEVQVRLRIEYRP